MCRYYCRTTCTLCAYIHSFIGAQRHTSHIILYRPGDWSEFFLRRKCKNSKIEKYVFKNRNE